MSLKEDNIKKIASSVSKVTSPKDQNNFKITDVAEVVSVDDPYHLGRIKVRIKGPATLGGDDSVLDSDLPWAFPLMPKSFTAQPKIKEAVFIFVFGKDREHSDRLYIGPIISQPDKLNFDPYYNTALRGFTFASQTPNVSVDTIPELLGIFPNPDDISVQGRYNTDITQKSNEVVIRAGKFEVSDTNSNNPYPFKFNTKTQAYIQIKNDVVISPLGSQTQQKGTVTNIVASKINLITHADGSPRFNVTNQNDLISSEEMANILDQAHQLPFGDVLLEYLILMKEALFYHVHNGSGNAPTDLTVSGNKQALAAFKSKANELEKSMLSKNIRIN
jgi:hypothetical protein